LEADKQFIFTS